MKTLNLKQMEKIEGGKMFGKTYECIEGSTGVVCIEKTHFFWFVINKDFAVHSSCDYCNSEFM